MPNKMTSKKTTKKSHKKPAKKISKKKLKTELKVNGESQKENKPLSAPLSPKEAPLSPKEAKAHHHRTRRLSIILVCIIMAFLMGGAYIWYKKIETKIPKTPQEVEKVEQQQIEQQHEESMGTLLTEVSNIEDDLRQANIRNPAVTKAITEIGRIKSGLRKSGQAFDEMSQTYDVTFQKLQQVEARMQHLEAQIVAAENLSLRVKAIEDENKRDNTQSSILLTAISQLRYAILTGNSFEMELQSIKAIDPKDPMIQKLATDLQPYARTGIPTLEQLKREYSQMISNVMILSITPSETDWINKALQKLASLIKVRRVNEPVEGDSTSSILKRGEDLLASNQIQETINELQKLEGAPREAAQTWMTKAASKVKAEKDLSEITSHILVKTAQRQN